MNRSTVVHNRAAARSPVFGAIVAGGARVGVTLGALDDDDIATYGVSVDGRFKSTDAAVITWLTTRYGPGAVTIGSDGKRTLNVDLYSVDDNRFAIAWHRAYSEWAAYWATHRNKNHVPGLEAGFVYDKIAEYDATVRQYQQQLKALGGTVYIDPTAPPPTKSDGSLANPISSITDTVKNVVWILGIGIVIYFGLMFVVPALVGAATTTKAAARSYREA